jgi:hypothetical protein
LPAKKNERKSLLRRAAGGGAAVQNCLTQISVAPPHRMSQADVRLDAPLLSSGRPQQPSYSSTNAAHSSSAASSVALSFDADTGEQVFVDPHGVHTSPAHLNCGHLAM